MLRRMVIGLSLLLLALPAAAESKPARPATAFQAKPTRPARAVAPRVATARAVEVLWGGQWWAAEVLETRGDVSRIHYTGWGAEWDEWVELTRMRAPARAPAGTPEIAGAAS